jgi:4-amino-4-deoxy-L-arabinose transferase-like glycosyltransferase
MTTLEAVEPLAEPRRLALRATLVALFAAVLVLPPVGQKVITTGDEARFAMLAQDMMRRDTWFDARVRDRRYRNKPLLYPWAIKVLSLPGGRVTQTTAHLPIALAAVVAVFFTALLGEQLFGRRAGVWAGLVLITTYSFFAHSQILLPDMIVVAFGMAALAAFWASVTHPPGTTMLALFYTALAFGVFAKGPMGLLPLAVVLVWVLTEDGWRGLRRLGSTVGVLVFVGVSAIWLLPFLLAGSGTFARQVVGQNWLNWYLGWPSPIKVLNYLGEGARGLVPWTMLLLLPLLAVRGQWRQGPFRFAFLAWLVPLALTALSQNHRTRYLLPTYPAAALLIAWWADARGTEPTRARLIVAALSAAGALVALPALVVPWLDPAEPAAVPGLWWKAALMGAGTIALVVFLCWAVLARRALFVPGVALGTALLLAFGVWVYIDWVNRTQDYPRLAALAERHARGGTVGIIGGRYFSIDVYLKRPLARVYTLPEFLVFARRPDRPVMVMPERVWGEMTEDERAGFDLLERLRVRRQVMLVVRARESL